MTTCVRCGKTNAAEIHTCTPRALPLAYELERHLGEFETAVRAAAELRRLHEENQGQAARIRDIYKQLDDTEKEVDDLRLLLRQALLALQYASSQLPLPHAREIEPTIKRLEERLK
jgi:uncharacterized protein Yka (UPF0111/DUF47 family)